MSFHLLSFFDLRLSFINFLPSTNEWPACYGPGVVLPVLHVVSLNAQVSPCRAVLFPYRRRLRLRKTINLAKVTQLMSG